MSGKSSICNSKDCKKKRNTITRANNRKRNREDEIASQVFLSEEKIQTKKGTAPPLKVPEVIVPPLPDIDPELLIYRGWPCEISDEELRKVTIGRRIAAEKLRLLFLKRDKCKEVEAQFDFQNMTNKEVIKLKKRNTARLAVKRHRGADVTEDDEAKETVLKREYIKRENRFVLPEPDPKSSPFYEARKIEAFHANEYRKQLRVILQKKT